MASFELAMSAAGPDQGPLGAGQLPTGRLRCAPYFWPIRLECLEAVEPVKIVRSRGSSGVPGFSAPSRCFSGIRRGWPASG